MIVYRTERREEHVKARLHEIARDARAWASTESLDHDSARDLLIEMGIIEAGIGDALNSEYDTPSPVLSAFRDASNAMGRLFIASWLGAPAGELRSRALIAAKLLDKLTDATLPDSVTVGIPEGYAYYALYPEQYAAAANEIVRKLAPCSVVCIGVRGIGTSLAAVVSATLEHSGCTVRSYTVRPHGHPFDRCLVLSPTMQREFQELRESLFIVIDEGPGLSGSSFASVASALASLGIPDTQIVLMPSWLPDGSDLVSDAARLRWDRHQKFTSTFEDEVLHSGRISHAMEPNVTVTDLSAGAWRGNMYADPSGWPAVQPQHERRKYLLHRCDVNAPSVLLKFAGLGRIGRAKYVRAEQIAAAGFGPPPVELAHGFLATEVLDAIPVSITDIDAVLLDRMADYLSFIAREFPAHRAQGGESLAEMIEVNTREVLGTAEHGTVERFLRDNALFDAQPVALDGRMLPHEWLRHGDAILKTDAVDHHDDHFFPGPQDIAWDLAATAVEFNLGSQAERYLLERYVAQSGDRGIVARMPWYRLAYLAHRTGYAMLAARVLEGNDDGNRWRLLAPMYRAQLGRTVARLSHAA